MGTDPGFGDIATYSSDDGYGENRDAAPVLCRGPVLARAHAVEEIVGRQ